MVQQADFPLFVPLGASIEIVDDDDPVLEPCPLVIVASPLESKRIYKKYNDYRIWYSIVATLGNLEVSSTNKGVANDIQALYQANDGEDGIASGVDSVIAFYPASFEPTIRKSFATLPDALPTVISHSPGVGLYGLLDYTGSKVAHVESRGKVRSLPIFEQRLEVEAPHPGMFFCLHNASEPAYAIAVPRDRQPMRLFMRPARVKNSHEVSERAAWQKIKIWLNDGGVSVDNETQYPQGENSFPDYQASISGQEYDIEMTSVPDLGRWTIKSAYRDLEKKISEVAAQPSETKESITRELSRVLTNKSKRAAESANQGKQRRAMLVISSWSTHELSNEMLPAGDLPGFDVIMVIEHGEFVHCLKDGGPSGQMTNS